MSCTLGYDTLYDNFIVMTFIRNTIDGTPSDHYSLAYATTLRDRNEFESGGLLLSELDGGQKISFN